LSSSEPAASAGCEIAEDYEQLRNSVLEGGNPSGCGGLVILLREGIAAWMVHASTRPATIAVPGAESRHAPAPDLANSVDADLIAVLASMVMASAKERCA